MLVDLNIPLSSVVDSFDQVTRLVKFPLLFLIKKDFFSPCSLEGRVKKIVHKAFWDLLESGLNEDPPEYEHAIKLFEEIKEAS